MRLLDKIFKDVKKNTLFVCEKCGWQIQKTNATDRLKCHCNNCDC